MRLNRKFSLKSLQFFGNGSKEMNWCRRGTTWRRLKILSCDDLDTMLAPEHKRIEEETLFRLAWKISPEKAGVARNAAAGRKYVDPLLAKREVHESIEDNLIAFALLGRLLNHGSSPFRGLPQISPHWLAFRRLFLQIYEVPIPAGIFDWRSPGSDEKREDWAKIEDLREEMPPLGASSAPGNYPWWEGMFPDLRVISWISRVRLKDYSEISLEGTKQRFVDHGTVAIEPECGALYEVVRAIEWTAVPKSETIEFSRPPSTLALLSRIVDEEVVEMDFEAEYAKAVRSVRAVLFDMAVEKVLGKAPLSDRSALEVEQRFCLMRLVENPFNASHDDRILFYIADGLGFEGSDFAIRLGRRLKTAEKEGSLPAVDPLKRTMTLLWLNEDWPLWLMQAPAMMELLKPLLPSTYPCTSNKIHQMTKNLKKSEKSGLHLSKKQLITKIECSSKGEEVVDVEFQNYISQNSLAERLRNHLKAIGLPRLFRGKIKVGK